VAILRRVALGLVLLAVAGAAALVAVERLGVPLPWSLAVTDEEPAAKDPAKAAASTEAPQETPPSPDAAIDAAAKALGGDSTSSAAVSIDISRISPDGTSVFAGRAAADSYVTVLENGKPAGTARTDENGEWMLSTEHKFASADPSLTYEVSRTPPAQPEKPAPQKAAPETAGAGPSAPASAASVAGDVMRKFESLVEQAREEAKQESAGAAKSGPAGEAPKAPASDERNLAAAPPVLDVQPNASTATAERTPPREPAVAAAPDTPSAGVKTDIIPVPIMFVYNEATLTPDGERAAALLLEYLSLKHLTAVELTGHADERGTDAYNYDLSRERLETVASLLKKGGYTGTVSLSPKGKSEPYMGVDRSHYPAEALYQLDRRVELRVIR
jgi:outer membrane protein OmpA-like peptidoglycan-associated protein